MKNAFVTFYSTHLDKKILEIHNGFSFGAHLISGDHFFITTEDDPLKIKEMLKNYDKIYSTTMLYTETYFLRNLVDERWVLGGPAVTSRSRNPYWKKLLSSATLVDATFEEMLGYPTGDIYSVYYDSLVKNISPKLLRVAAICDKRCYWGKCKFCNINYNWGRSRSEKTFGRDIEKVLSQLPDYSDSLVTCYLACMSTTPEILETVIQSKHRKQNYVYQFQTRFDKEIKKVIESSDDLSNFIFGVGLEYPSQTAINILNKGLDLDTELETLKIATKKGAKILLFFLCSAPILTDKTLYEVIANIDWIKDNIEIMDNTGRIFFEDIPLCQQIFTENNFINKLIRNYKGITPAYFDVVWSDEDVAKSFGTYKTFDSEFGGRVYISELDEKQKYLNEIYKEKLKSIANLKVVK